MMLYNDGVEILVGDIVSTPQGGGLKGIVLAVFEQNSEAELSSGGDPIVGVMLMTEELGRVLLETVDDVCLLSRQSQEQ